MAAAHIRRLTLANFRSYHAATLTLAQPGPVVLTGANGAGKTNLIEAVSLLAPGRGLRRATMEEMAFSEGDGAWAVNAEVEGMLGLATLGTGIDPSAGEDSSPTRKCRVDREAVSSAVAFADHLRIVWLTPAMDPLFNGPASERRRFLDRLVLAVDAQHSSRVAALERSLRSRNRLLEDARSDSHWLDAIEHETAEVAVAVAAARAEAVARLSASLLQAREQRGLPDAEIALQGWMEALLPSHSGTEIEDRYRALLKENRARDAAAGRTLDGPHLSDLAVTHAGKGIPAREASTGEQKALLIRLVLAHAGLIKDMTGFAPI
ncbi:MAG TPA: DNA replication/repair protein RecF, partial [Pseudolabrys sp.]|nr:DNA replication/repair protein RecF [Pseudolabrys sp.]